MTKKSFLAEMQKKNIATIDAEGGHIMSNHIRVPEQILLDRAKTRYKAANLASAFTISEDEIMDCIMKACEDYADELVDWLNDNADGDDYCAYYTFSKPIGKGYSRAPWHNWSDGAVDCSQIVVVFAKRTRRDGTGFIIKTAYPTTNQQDYLNFNKKSQH